MKKRTHSRSRWNLPVAFLLIVTALAALGWGNVGHLFINTKAVYNLPAAMALFINKGVYFGQHASDADYRKGTDPAEAPKHFIDIESYPAFQNLTLNLDSLKAIYGTSGVTSIGILPWATVQTYDSLVTSLKRGSFTRAESIAADLGHYVGDGHQPLHVTVNYDGQMTGNGGIHSQYETTMINSYASRLSVSPVPAVYVSNRFAYVMAYLLVSNSLVDSILQADDGARSLSGWNGSGSPPAGYIPELWNECRSVTLREMQGATVALADLWYSAWVDAGLIASSASSLPGGALPVTFSLGQNYPNPFNPATNIQFSIVNRQLTIVKVFDVLGREVATLLNEVKEPGTYTVKFDGAGLASGVYFCRLSVSPLARRDLVIPARRDDGQAGDFVQTRKLLLLR